MKSGLSFASMLLSSVLVASPVKAGAESSHQFSFTSIEGEPMSLSDFRGKAVLVVNTASFCGFTPQYRALQALYDGYKDRGLVVLGVPSNDFGEQEPGTEAEIKEFCEVNYDVTFPMTEKEVVSGRNAHPFYKWAKDNLGSKGTPRWNFHKILIDSQGLPVAGFSTVTKPGSKTVVSAVERALPGS